VGRPRVLFIAGSLPLTKQRSDQPRGRPVACRFSRQARNPPPLRSNRSNLDPTRFAQVQRHLARHASIKKSHCCHAMSGLLVNTRRRSASRSSITTTSAARPTDTSTSTANPSSYTLVARTPPDRRNKEILARIVSPGTELFKHQPRSSRPPGLQPSHTRSVSEEMDNRRHPSSFQQLEKVGELDSG